MDPECPLPFHALVEEAVCRYLENLPDLPQGALHKLVLHQAELGLYRAIWRFTAGNQTQAAALLGLSRETFRRKLIHYALL